jgi:hypothetical protein
MGSGESEHDGIALRRAQTSQESLYTNRKHIQSDAGEPIQSYAPIPLHDCNIADNFGYKHIAVQA